MSLLDRITQTAEAGWDAARAAWTTLARTDAAAPPPPEGAVAPPAYNDRGTQVYGSSTTPEALTATLYDRNAGHLAGWHDLADHALRTNPHLATCLLVRCDSVVETDFAAQPGLGRQGVAARRAADAANELLAEWRRTGLDVWLAEMVASRYYAAGLHEVLWARHERGVAPTGLVRVAERRLSYASGPSDPNPWALRITGELAGRRSDGWTGVPVTDFHPDKFLVHEPRTLGGHRASEGLFAAAVWFWLFGVLSWRDLMRLQEMLGRPPIVAYYAAGGGRTVREGTAGAPKGFDGGREASPEERALVRRVVESLTSSLRAALPDTVRLEKLPVEIPAQPLQVLTGDRCDALVSKLFLGTTGVIDIVPGSRAAQETAFTQSHTFWRSDCRFVARQLTRLVAMYVRANPDRFGEGCPLPEVVAQTEPEKSPLQAAQEIRAALDAGLRVPRAWAHRVLKVPEAAAGEDTLSAPPLARAA